MGRVFDLETFGVFLLLGCLFSSYLYNTIINDGYEYEYSRWHLLRDPSAFVLEVPCIGPLYTANVSYQS